MIWFLRGWLKLAEFGVYGAGGAGAAIGRGAQAIVLANQNGAVLALTGYQRGLQINADLAGLAITMR